MVIHALRDLPWIGEDPLFDLANTVLLGAGPGGSDVDVLADPPLLARWRALADHRLRDQPLEDLLTWRTLIRAGLATRADHGGSAVVTEPLRDELNQLARVAPVAFQLNPDGHLDQLDHGGTIAAVLARETLVLIAGSQAQLLRRCPAPSCGMFYLARRRDQNWCTVGCGNRARAARRRPPGSAGPATPGVSG